VVKITNRNPFQHGRKQLIQIGKIPNKKTSLISIRIRSNFKAAQQC
jgi:hypothetical protein